MLFHPQYNKSSINTLRTKLPHKQVIHGLLLIVSLMPYILHANHVTATKADSLNAAPDSTIALTYSASKDSEGGIESKVSYNATDSMVVNIEEQKIYLYGESQVNYESTQLNAEYMIIDMKTNTMQAFGGLDSNGLPFGTPEFEDGPQKFTAKRMDYNFRTKKGKIREAITQQGDGYIHGEEIKMVSEKVLYIRKGKYTTCDADTPHFHIEASKLKLIKDDRIITGPAYLKIADIPTPLAIPFGFFPNTTEKSSGIVIPQYGHGGPLGFFLMNGGYYFDLGDHMDLKVLGDIYSRGSWGSRLVSNYADRYKFRGQIDVSYAQIITGVADHPSYALKENMFLKWKHTQDPKASPTSRFSADVNAGSVNNFQNTYSTDNTNYLTNTFKSNISYSKSFAGTPFNLALNASHSQNNQTGDMTVNLPEATFNMSRIYPFQRTTKVGKDRWYEKIGVAYTNNAKSVFTNQQESFFTDSTIQDMQNGMRHNIPVSTSIKVLKHFTLNPVFNYSEKWYLQSTEHTYSDLGVITANQVHGFARAYEYGVTTALSTKLYGQYGFAGKNLPVFRHVFTPSVRFNLKPDFSDEKYGFYKTNEYRDESGAVIATDTYSRFENTMYGGPSGSESGLLSFNLLNNLEMKVKSKKDTVTGTKKIRLIDNFNIRSSYNMVSDSLNWSDVTMNFRTKLFDAIDINVNEIRFSPYQLSDVDATTINQFQYDKNKQFGRLTAFSAAVGFRLKSKDGGKKRENPSQDETIDQINDNLDMYIDFTVPWTMSLNYNFRYAKPKFESTITNTISLNGDVRVTEKWKIGVRSGYDFIQNEITFTNLDIYRDMHCWELRITAVPFGPRKGYNVTLKVKSSILQDLKLTRTNHPYEN